MAKILTESLEDYLEAIAELCSSNGHAHTKEIADKLQVKMPSVTGALRQLAEMGFITYNTHYPVELTASGKEVAERVAARHKILKKFFTDILGMSSVSASDAACHLEHLIDENTTARFVLFSQAIENRRDAASLRTFLAEAMELMLQNPKSECRTLASLSPGETACIKKFSRNIRHPENLGLKIGDIVSVDSISLDKTHLHLLLNSSSQLELPLDSAENIFV